MPKNENQLRYFTSISISEECGYWNLHFEHSYKDLMRISFSKQECSEASKGWMLEQLEGLEVGAHMRHLNAVYEELEK